MSNLSPYIKKGGLLLSVLMLLGCGGVQKVAEVDPVTLLHRGEYESARKAVEAKGFEDPRDRAIVALSFLAESPSEKSANLAVQTLCRGPNGVSSLAAAKEMLELVQVLPPIENIEFSLVVVEVGLGTSGYGPYAKSKSRPEPGSEAALLVAVSALNQLNIYMSVAGENISVARVLEMWNGCYSLLGGSFAVNDASRAWQLYTSIAGIAVVFANTSPTSDLSKVLLLSAVLSIEQNPEISFAARCDLSSPFDKLKPVLLRHRELLGRLERAVAGATGCTLGTYAPEQEK